MKDGPIVTLFSINGSALSQPGREHKQPHFTLNIGIWTLTSNFGVFVPTSDNQCGQLPPKCYSSALNIHQKQSGKAGDNFGHDLWNFACAWFYLCSSLHGKTSTETSIKGRLHWGMTKIVHSEFILGSGPRVLSFVCLWGLWVCERDRYTPHTEVKLYHLCHIFL